MYVYVCIYIYTSYVYIYIPLFRCSVARILRDCRTMTDRNGVLEILYFTQTFHIADRTEDNLLFDAQRPSLYIEFPSRWPFTDPGQRRHSKTNFGKVFVIFSEARSAGVNGFFLPPGPFSKLYIYIYIYIRGE